ncbi:hypothetical protein [Brachyspira sp. G79]|uniref:hypothetical protein n=1 Tax=Brachyspira sp. G79 TaxID=1358104 RepID=UPI000BBC5CDC|nr:hypothetical protein [Brachyspira sp. G79]PCG20399.1 hypothetical protein KQ44_10575 [Brachyspira sp. G79]
MRKISILLILFVFALSCSNATTNPNNNVQNDEDTTQNSTDNDQNSGNNEENLGDSEQNNGNDTQNGIPLSQRAGTYTGTYVIEETAPTFVIVLNDKAQITSILIGGIESLKNGQPIEITDGADYRGTTTSPFDVTLIFGIMPVGSTISIEFKSETDKTAGATAQVIQKDLAGIPQNPKIKTVELTYTAN